MLVHLGRQQVQGSWKVTAELSINDVRVSLQEHFVMPSDVIHGCDSGKDRISCHR